jgi:hypothetical protein
MLHVNEDTNDELFRKAAEDYYLREDNPDWEKLLDKIETVTPHSTNKTVVSEKKRHSRFLLFNSPRSILRIFRFSSWFEKSKKKINAGIFCRRLLLFPEYSY